MAATRKLVAFNKKKSKSKTKTKTKTVEIGDHIFYRWEK